jgi:hypothetical protein
MAPTHDPDDRSGAPEPRYVLLDGDDVWLDLTGIDPIGDDDPLPDLPVSPKVPLEVLETLAHWPPLVPDPPGPTNIRRDNPRKQGEIGLTDAIGWFGRRAMLVSIPLADNQPYDLVVDIEGYFAKVQVKTATGRSKYGRFVVTIQTAGGNQSFHTRKPWDPEASDILYVLTDAGDRYVIPSVRVTAKRMISLGDKWERYRVPRHGAGLPPAAV